MASDQEIEAAARAMRTRQFEILDGGYTTQNFLAERRFLNAEKVVKRARKDARLALEAAEIVRQEEDRKSMAGFDDETIAELRKQNTR